MDLFAQLKNADKSKLKKVKTVIKTESGKQFVEERNDERTTLVECDQRFEGFVVDLKPDLHVGRVTRDLLIGSQDIALNLNLLKKYQVTHILNVATGIKNVFADSFVYKTVEMFDTPEFNLKNGLKSCIEFIDTCRKSSGVCLVHCNAGVSRSASVVIAYLMSSESISYEDAFNKVKLARSSINPNSGFVKQLKSLEASIVDKHCDLSC